MARIDRRGLSAEQQGMAAFAFADFGGLSGGALETNALPYKVMATALLMAEEGRRGVRLTPADLPGVFRRFGFIEPDTIANWRGLAPPRFERPMGMESGDLTAFPGLRVEASNLGCASCHAGLLYDAAGRPTATAWLGLPNTSLNLEAYSDAVYRATVAAMRDRKRFAKRIKALFPMGLGERVTLQWFVLPRAAKRLARLESTLRRSSPYSNGGAGRTNGVGALKFQLGVLDRGHYEPRIGTVSIPDLSSRGLRSSLLVDGCYAVPGAARFAELTAAADSATHREALAAIVAFFTVPIMGVSPARAERSIPEMRAVMDYLATAVSPPFPGAVDEPLAARGRELFETHCAGCHGRYEGEARPLRLTSFPNRLIPQERMGSDSLRWHAIDSVTVARIGKTGFARRIDTRRTGGYVAPILSGLWATAPYLHNGSVPTIWHLMHPEARPERFQVGGHRLDYERLGIAGKADSAGIYREADSYVPWSEPELLDTRAPGLDRRGHERPFRELADAEKRALVEFLKCL